MWNICSGIAENSRDLSEFLMMITLNFEGKNPYPRQIPKSDIAGGDWICAVARWSPTKFDLRYPHDVAASGKVGSLIGFSSHAVLVAEIKRD